MSKYIIDSFIPKYRQVYEDIKQTIETDLEIGDRLPSEVELLDKYNVSRSTLRKALKLLSDDGQILIKHGIGMFVKSPGIQMNTSDVLNYDGFYEMLTREGLEVKINLISSKKVIPPDYVADIFGCSESQKIHLIHRMFSVKEMPIGVFFTYFSPEVPLSEELIDRMKRQPIRPLIQSEVIKSDAMRYNIEFKKAPKEIAKDLNVDAKDLIVNVNQTLFQLFEDEYLPFEVTTIYLLPEMSKFNFFIKS